MPDLSDNIFSILSETVMLKNFFVQQDHARGSVLKALRKPCEHTINAGKLRLRL
jgi:hypothetical protein